MPNVNDVENGAQEIGHVRRKPGKGYPTPCMSCTDKMTKWCYMGIQGRDLMDILSKPIYLKSLIICTEDLVRDEVKIAAEKAFKRESEILKDKIKGNFKFQLPMILTATLPLNNNDLRLNNNNTLETGNFATTSINWTKYKNGCGNFEKSEISGNFKWVKNGCYEVVVGNTGLKLGANKDLVVDEKDMVKLRSRLCKNEIKRDIESIRNKLNIERKDESMYQINWQILRNNSFFSRWINV